MTCAMPDCQGDASGIFCPAHYFRLPPKQAQWLVRWQIRTMRCVDADTKRHMRDQLHGYVREAIRTIEQSEALSPPSALGQCPPQSPLAAGTSHRQVR